MSGTILFSLCSLDPASERDARAQHVRPLPLGSGFCFSLLAAVIDVGYIIGAPEGIRTPDPQLRRLLLYPPELQAHLIADCRS